MPDGNKIINLRNNLKISQNEFSKTIEVSQANISQIENNKIQLSAKIAQSISRAYNVDMEWLLLSDHDKPIFKSDKSHLFVNEDNAPYTTEKTPNDLPFYRAETTFDHGKVLERSDAKADYMYSLPNFVDSTLALNIFGHEMAPAYDAGDIVICKKLSDFSLIVFGNPYLVITDAYMLVRYLRKSNDSKNIDMIASDLDFDKITLPLKKINHLFAITGKISRITI